MTAHDKLRSLAQQLIDALDPSMYRADQLPIMQDRIAASASALKAFLREEKI